MSKPHANPTYQRETYLRLAAVIGIILTSLIVLIKVDDLLVSFVLAFVINYTIGPFINWLERKQVSRSLAVIVIFSLSGILLFLGVYLIVPLVSDQLQDLLREAPKLQADLVSLISKVESHFKIFFKTNDVNFANAINTWLLNKSSVISGLLPSVVSHSFTVVLLAPLLAFFMLQDGRQIGRSLLSLVPNMFFELALNLFHQINQQLGGFIRARFLEAAIVGVVVWFGLLAISFPFATLLAIVAAITNLIPYIGPIIGIVPAIAIALISPAGHIADPVGLNIILVCLVYFVAQLIDMLIIIPVVVAKIVDLHPALVIIVIIIGAQIMGVLGMMISIPVASVIKVTITAIYEHLIDFPRLEED